MANDIVLSTARELGYTDARLELIRATAAQGCDDFEVAQLLIVAHQTGLDPLQKQIYLIKRWNSKLKREVATPQTSIDGYRAIADRTQRYAPGKEPTYEYDADGLLVSATAHIKKLVRGTWHEVSATAFWDEYVQTTKDGHPTQFWAKMPRVMLAKVAETLALRRAFPAELGGLYTSEEMAQADKPDVVDAQYVEVQEQKPAQLPAAPQEPMATPSTIDRLESLAAAYYKTRWNDKFKRGLVHATTKERTADITLLTATEAQTLIDKFVNAIETEPEPATPEPA